MTVQHLHIEGFGPFYDRRLDLAPGLNLLVGPNEAGKSSLMRFVRYVLFGPLRGKKPVALAGGRLGGALVLEDASDTLRVQRIDRKLQVSRNGRPAPEGSLAQLLGHVDRASYEAVFACDLDDLSELDALASDDLKAKLFAASVLGAGVDLKTIRTGWAKRSKALGRTNRGGTLRALRNDLRMAESALDQARNQARALPELLAEQQTQRLQEETARQALWKAGAERSRLRALQQAAEPLRMRALELRWLAQHEAPPSPPADLEQVLRRLLLLERAQGQAELLVEENRPALERAEQAVDALQVDLRILAQHEVIERLARQGASLADPERAQADAARQEEALQTAFADLGIPSLDGIQLDDRTGRHLRGLASRVAPRSDLGTPTRTRATARAELGALEEQLQAHETPAPGRLALHADLALLGSLHDQLPGLQQQLDQSQAESDALEAEARQLLAVHPGLPRDVDPTRLQALQDAVRDWSRAQEAQQARTALTEARREALTQELHALSVPVDIPSLPADIRLWSEGRTTHSEQHHRLAKLQAERERLQGTLDSQLAPLPWLSDREALRRNARLPWNRLEQAAQAVLQARTDVPLPAPEIQVASDAPARLALATHLQGRSHDVRSWRQIALATLAFTLLLLAAAALGLLLGRLDFAALAGALFLAALLLAAFAGYASRSAEAEVTRGLLELQAPEGVGPTEFLPQLHAEVARSHPGVSPDLLPARLQQLRALLEPTDAPELDAAQIVDLCQAVQPLLHTLTEAERLDQEIEELRAHLSRWTAQGTDAARLLGSRTPGSLPEALELARRIFERSAARDRAQAQHDERARSIRHKQEQLAALQSDAAGELPEQAPLRALLGEFGVPDLPVDQAPAWTEALLARVELDRQIRRAAHTHETLRLQTTQTRDRLTEALQQAEVEAFSELRPAVEAAAEMARRRDALLRDREEAARRLQQATAELERVQEQARERSQAIAALDDALKSAGWPACSAEEVAELHTRLRQARQLQTAWSQAADAAREAQQSLEAWLDAVNQVATAIEQPPPSPEEARSWVDRTLQEARQAASDRTLLDERQRTAEHAATALHEAEARKQAATDALSEALAEAGFPDVPAAESALAGARERQQHAEALAAAERSVLAQLGVDTDLEAAAEQASDPSLAARIAEATTQEEQAAQQVEDQVRRIAELQVSIDTLSASADVPAAQAEVERLQACIHDAAMEVAALELAQALLGQTYDTYVRENQPAVLEQASRLLRVSSDGDMQDVRELAGELYVESTSGALRTPDQLSRGAREMLYLVIRFALALEHGRTVPLPVVLDDVLVNQDPERARGLARVICDMAQTQQVVLLTCRPETEALLLDLQPDAAVHHLQRYGGHSEPLSAPDRSNESTLDDTLDAPSLAAHWLTHNPGWQRKRSIQEGADLTEHQWNQVLKAVQHGDPRIEHNGRDRAAAKYRAPSATL